MPGSQPSPQHGRVLAGRQAVRKRESETEERGSNLPRGSPTLPCFLRARSSCCPPLSFFPESVEIGRREGGRSATVKPVWPAAYRVCAVGAAEGA